MIRPPPASRLGENSPEHGTENSVELRDEIQWDSDQLPITMPITIQEARPRIKGRLMKGGAKAGRFHGGKRKT